MLVKMSETLYVDPKNITELYVSEYRNNCVVVKMKSGDERSFYPKPPMTVYKTLDHLAERINSALQLQRH
jgi:hypothetical protein